MKDIKIAFFDIDGTILPFGQSNVPTSTIESLIKLKEKGIKIIVATGKSLNQLLDTAICNLPFDGYITLNGQLCYDDKFHKFFGTAIRDEEMVVLSQAFKGKRIPFSLVTEFNRYINYVDDEVIRHNIETNSKVPEIDKYRGEKVYQITAYTSSHNVDILKNILDYCDVTYWAEGAIDIYAKGGGKMNAIKSWLSRMNLTKENAIAFGDGANDAEMIKYCGIGVAMGNAMEITKASSDFVTSDSKDDGIELALKHFDLIN